MHRYTTMFITNHCHFNDFENNLHFWSLLLWHIVLLPVLDLVKRILLPFVVHVVLFSPVLLFLTLHVDLAIKFVEERCLCAPPCLTLHTINFTLKQLQNNNNN